MTESRTPLDLPAYLRREHIAELIRRGDPYARVAGFIQSVTAMSGLSDAQFRAAVGEAVAALDTVDAERTAKPAAETGGAR